MNRNFGIIELYCGGSGKIGFYNNQELGIAKAMTKLGYNCFVFYPDIANKTIIEEKYDEITVVKCPAKHIGVHGYFDLDILKKYHISYAQIGSDNQLFAPEVIKYCEKNSIVFYNYVGTIKSDTDNMMKAIISSFLMKRNIYYYRRSKCFAKTNSVVKELKEYNCDSEIAHVGLDISFIPKTLKDPLELKKQLGIPFDRKILLFIGRMEQYKRPFSMLKLLDKNEDYYGIIIGTGSLSNDVNRFVEEKLANRVKRIERIENKEIHNFYKIADYYLNFNEKEIFGMGMLEAMYQGCNVIAIMSPGATEIVKNRKTGYIVNNITEMTEIIDQNQKCDKEVIIQSIFDDFIWEKTVISFDKWLKKMID